MKTCMDGPLGGSYKYSWRLVSIQIKRCLALIAFCCATEHLIAAVRAKIPGFFIFDPLFCTYASTMGNRSQNYLFANGHGKIFNMLTGKIITGMAAGITPGRGAVPYLALPAVHEKIIR